MQLMPGIFFLLSIPVLMVGCKIEVIVPSGGDVKSESSTRDCFGGSLCEHNVTDLTFNETFTAVARPGYVFTKWNKGHGFLCGDSVDPVCNISLLGVPEGDTGVNALLASGHIFYVMPHFQFVGVDTDGDGIADHLDEDDDNDGIMDGDDKCPLNPAPDCVPDTITVNGRVWAQPDQFLNLSWDAINDVCPGGVCGKEAILNGWDISGWTWASDADLCELFNSYLEISDLDVATCPSIHVFVGGEPAAQISDAIFERDGWRATYEGPVCSVCPISGRQIEGWIYRVRSDGAMSCSQAFMGEDATAPLPPSPLLRYGLIFRSYVSTCGLAFETSGAWFYR